MRNYYNKVFATSSPLFFVFLIAVLILGFLARQPITMPNYVNYNSVVALSKFGLTSNFIQSASTFFIWVEFILNMFTIIAIFSLGKVIVGKTGGLCAAFLFAIYPYFTVNMYSMNIYLVHTFFYMSLWRDFIYRFKYAGLIFLALLATTLLYSVVLEFLKSKIVIISHKLRKTKDIL